MVNAGRGESWTSGRVWGYSATASKSRKPARLEQPGGTPVATVPVLTTRKEHLVTGSERSTTL
jgi:hypothetical protein